MAARVIQPYLSLSPHHSELQTSSWGGILKPSISHLQNVSKFLPPSGKIAAIR